MVVITIIFFSELELNQHVIYLHVHNNICPILHLYCKIKKEKLYIIQSVNILKRQRGYK